ncbi:MAG: hypothetical protein ACT4PP_08065 [Sporichthyaceae bacterium]
MENSVIIPELEALAGLKVAVEHALKLVGDQAWRLAEPDVLDLLRRHHVLTAKLASLGLDLVREAQTRGMAASNAATSDSVRGHAATDVAREREGDLHPGDGAAHPLPRHPDLPGGR